MFFRISHVSKNAIKKGIFHAPFRTQKIPGKTTDSVLFLQNFLSVYDVNARRQVFNG